MGRMTVWALERVSELNNQIGFVVCDKDLGARLIDAGKAQDPYGREPLRRPSRAAMPASEPAPEKIQTTKVVEGDGAPTYSTRELVAKRGARK